MSSQILLNKQNIGLGRVPNAVPLTYANLEDFNIEITASQDAVERFLANGVTYQLNKGLSTNDFSNYMKDCMFEQMFELESMSFENLQSLISNKSLRTGKSYLVIDLPSKANGVILGYYVAIVTANSPESIAPSITLLESTSKCAAFKYRVAPLAGYGVPLEIPIISKNLSGTLSVTARSSYGDNLEVTLENSKVKILLKENPAIARETASSFEVILSSSSEEDFIPFALTVRVPPISLMEIPTTEDNLEVTLPYTGVYTRIPIQLIGLPTVNLKFSPTGDKDYSSKFYATINDDNEGNYFLNIYPLSINTSGGRFDSYLNIEAVDNNTVVNIKRILVKQLTE